LNDVGLNGGNEDAIRIEAEDCQILNTYSIRVYGTSRNLGHIGTTSLEINAYITLANGVTTHRTIVGQIMLARERKRRHRNSYKYVKYTLHNISYSLFK
jgi:hypothetical protein